MSSWNTKHSSTVALVLTLACLSACANGPLAVTPPTPEPTIRMDTVDFIEPSLVRRELWWGRRTPIVGVESARFGPSRNSDRVSLSKAPRSYRLLMG